MKEVVLSGVKVYCTFGGQYENTLIFVFSNMRKEQRCFLAKETFIIIIIIIIIILINFSIFKLSQFLSHYFVYIAFLLLLSYFVLFCLFSVSVNLYCFGFACLVFRFCVFVLFLFQLFSVSCKNVKRQCGYAAAAASPH